jgi:hypothetical protein
VGNHQIISQLTLGSTRVTQKFDPHVGSSSTGEESDLKVKDLGFCDELGLVLIASDMVALHTVQ